MPHLAAGAGRRLSVQVQVRIRTLRDRGEQAAPILKVPAQHVDHDGGPAQFGAAERQAANGADVLLELGGGACLLRPVAAIVDPRAPLR